MSLSANCKRKEIIKGLAMFHIVEFHADGGQMCIPGIRCFIEKADADIFATHLRLEPGHTCGSKSVKQYVSDAPVENRGVVYPGVANMGRDVVIINGKLHLC